MRRHHLLYAATILCSGCMLFDARSARAQEAEQLDIRRAVEDLRLQLEIQRSISARQSEQIAAQQAELDQLKALVSSDMADLRGRGVQSSLAQASPPPLPGTPVGEAPQEPETQVEVQAIPQQQGVLTPAGQLVFDPSIEYTRSSTNRLAFRGFELVPGIQIGIIEASDADRDTVVAAAGFRFGLTDRLEIDARIPYMYRSDRLQVVQQRDQGIVRNLHLSESNIGDVEFGIRYQLNRPRPLSPIFVASLRAKTNTGRGPFDVDYDEFGVANGLATGSGFWAVQPGVSFLLPSDPVVIYGGVSYSYQFAANVNRTIGGAFVGRVDPGDAIGANLGFGFALNPRFSFSLGYRHTYIRPTSTEIGGTIQESTDLQVGSFVFGMSYGLTQKRFLNVGFEFGMTKEAPDVGLTLRMPIGIRF